MTVKEKNKVRGLIQRDFKTYYKAILIKTVWYWQNERRTPHEWNIAENPEIDPPKYSQLILTKE